MFNYTTTDRPRIFTTPAGSAMGLFKTWMMNYMAAMAEYSGQAMKRELGAAGLANCRHGGCGWSGCHAAVLDRRWIARLH